MEQVEKTKDYDKFKLLTGNRPLDRYHLKKLRQSIEKNNHLNLHPIIVNKDFEIIDGQHRHSVAKELGIDLFYIQSDKIEDDHLIDCNVNQKCFEVENYIAYFAQKDKNPEYILLLQMMKLSALKPRALLTLIIGNVSNVILDFLKTGRFKFPPKDYGSDVLDFYCDFIAYAKDKRIKPLSMFTNHNFTRAFRWLSLTTGFQKDLFFKKLDNRWFDLKPQASSEIWYQLLIDIYNHRNRDKIDVEYGSTA